MQNPIRPMNTKPEQQPLTDEEIRVIREQVAVALRVVDYLQGCKIEYTNSSAKPDRRLAFLTEGLDKLPRLLDEIERLRAIEAQAIEQSEHVQREWLSPSEAEGLRREVERLRADLNRFSEWAEEACDVIVNGVGLMTVKQLQQWEGCRAVVETCPSLLHESQEDRARWIPVTEKLPDAAQSRSAPAGAAARQLPPAVTR